MSLTGRLKLASGRKSVSLIWCFSFKGTAKKELKAIGFRRIKTTSYANSVNHKEKSTCKINYKCLIINLWAQLGLNQ
jgi:hypothetical protein